ncbi:hypothetical protein PpBr36_04721 [Pyricularia pennisetigena]|uniref:hypothetical protein n=1 Tax=Pyricularia pennisetigena TaxID=1578925 RepID=UPI00114EC3B1|nr:hypothetical protein PpBr36_04721 [Pyricularia pennisetigena]TLS26260.1 hypothetical protein PpBr36_04721 [Pyricularia pennisetigena]
MNQKIQWNSAAMMVTNSLGDKVLQVIQSCDSNTKPHFRALLELHELLKGGIKLDFEEAGSEKD